MTDDPCRRYCSAKADLLRSHDRYAILERERDYWKQETEGLRREREAQSERAQLWQSRCGEAQAREAKLRCALALMDAARESDDDFQAWQTAIDATRAALKGDAT